MRQSVENVFMSVHTPLVELYQWVIGMIPATGSWGS